MAILLKTASVRVSSIQIMQVRVQNKGKSVWKSRNDGDVSAADGYSTSEMMDRRILRPGAAGINESASLELSRLEVGLDSGRTD